MIEKPSNYTSTVLWTVTLVLLAIACVFLWEGRVVKLREIEKQQMYLVAAEGFRFMHNDADIPLTAKNMTLSNVSADEVVLEADGFQRVKMDRKPMRWVATLVHSNSLWTVTESKWKK